MVAYSFQKRFVEPIRNRTKTQTIRACGKRRHARPGEMLQLYTGMRTKSCEKIVSDVRCLNVVEVRLVLDMYAWRFDKIQVDQKTLSNGEHAIFALNDGFATVQEMARFWHQNHGYKYFDGVLITWGHED